MSPLRIGTRGSRLALWQANFVADLLRSIAAPRAVEIIEIQTSGDQAQDRPLTEIGGEGVFTKEIQRAVLAGKADVAVHSLKDLPTLVVEGLALAAVPPRGPVQDVLVSCLPQSFDHLLPEAVVATSSPRRQAQALHRRSDLRLVEIRGNVETRIKKLVDENLDALILAQAGLERLILGQDSFVEPVDLPWPTLGKDFFVESLSWMLPAVGQGALGLECRADDATTRDLLQKLEDGPTRQAVDAERAFLRALGGGCQVPIGVYTSMQQDTLHLRGVVLSPDGKQRLEAEGAANAMDSESLGMSVAQQLLSKGAQQLLNAV
jgi:hydroxymethylbilane synthase